MAVLELVLLCLSLLAPQDPKSNPSAEAARLWERGERRAALAAWTAELAEHPDDQALRLLVARRNMDVRAYQAALDTLAALDNQQGEIRSLRAAALYALARYEQAAELLDVHDPHQCLLLLDALEALGRDAQASMVLEQALQLLGADDPRVQTARGRERTRAGDDPGAEACFRAAVAADPLAREALFGLGQALLRQGKREDARLVLERHQALVPLLDAWEFAWQSLDLEPLSASNHAHIGDLERELARFDPRRLELAQASYARALELAPDAELVPIALRVARFFDEDRHDSGAALAALARAEARVRDPRLAVRAGDLLLSAGRPAEAASAFERALALRPGDAQVQARLTQARAAAGGR